MRRRRQPRGRGPVLGGLLLLAVGTAAARDPALPPGLPPGLTLPQSAAPLPVVVDTATAVLAWPAGVTPPRAVSVLPDTAGFGEPLFLVLDFPAGASVPDTLGLTTDAGWLAPEPAAARGFWDRWRRREPAPPPAVAGLPAPDGPRRLLPWRPYRTMPFRIRAGDAVSAVIPVRGQVDDLAATAAIRGPRVWGWDPAALAAVAVGLVALVLAGFWLWSRRGLRAPGPAAWDCPPPAWLEAALALQDCREAGLLERGDGGAFLDRLSAVARGFVADRYRINARELTGPEIAAACRRLRHDPGPAGRLAALIDELDRQRYCPGSADPAWARARLEALVADMAAAHVPLRFTPVEPARLSAAERAWRELTAAGRGVR